MLVLRSYNICPFFGLLVICFWFAKGSLQQRVIRQLDDRRHEVRIADHPTAMALAGLVLNQDQFSGWKLPALTAAHFSAEFAGQDTEQEPLRCVMPFAHPAGAVATSTGIGRRGTTRISPSVVPEARYRPAWSRSPAPRRGSFPAPRISV